MSYTLKVDLLENSHRLRVGGNSIKTTISMHSTGNPKSTAENERAWLDNPTNDREASWHYVVGEGIVIQAVPDKETAWHSGNSQGNRTSIAVEIIETGNREEVLKTAAEFVADKLMELDLDTKAIRMHKDWSGKNCPRILIDKAYIKGNMDWDWFIDLVKEFMEGAEMVENSKIIIDNKEVAVRRILKDGTNYIAIRDVANAVGYDVSNKGNIAVLNKK